MRCGWCLKSCRKTIPSTTDATAETTSHKDACTAEGALKWYCTCGAVMRLLPILVICTAQSCTCRIQRRYMVTINMWCIMKCRCTAMHLLEKSWQVQLAWLRLVLHAVQALHRTIGRVCQEVPLEGIRKAVTPAKWCSLVHMWSTLGRTQKDRQLCVLR